MLQMSGTATMVEAQAAQNGPSNNTTSSQIAPETALLEHRSEKPSYTANFAGISAGNPAIEPSGSSPAALAVLAAKTSVKPHLEESFSANSSRPVSPTDQDSDEPADGPGDLQFKKKEFPKLRTQSFQSVLSSASLKSLKHQFTAPTQPQLKRNPSTVLQGNTKNFQLFIQAPVLLLVTNLRTADDVEIGQRLPFDQSLDASRGHSRQALFLDPAAATDLKAGQASGDDSTLDEDDTYKEETTLQQQRLTLNALKKLSLSLAPIIRSEDDDQGPQLRQLTTKLLNSARPDLTPRPDPRPEPRPLRDLRPVLRSAGRKLKPYQPAEVDLSQFLSLTRQSKHCETGPAQAEKPTDSQIMRPSHAQVERAAHSQVTAAPQNPLQPQTQADSLPLLKNTARSGMVSNPEHRLELDARQGSRPGRISDLNPGSRMTNVGSGPQNSFSLSTQIQAQNQNQNQSQNQSQNQGQSHQTLLSDLRSLRMNGCVEMQQKESPKEPASELESKSIGPQKKTGSDVPMGLQTHSNSRTQNYMRPAQMSTTLSHREMSARSQGLDMAHGGSFGSLKLHGPDKRLQQINGFRSPMYVPAVLRKTVDESLENGPEAGLPGEHFTDYRDHAETAVGPASSSTLIKSVDLAFSGERSVSPQFHAQTGPYELSRRQYDRILRAAPTRRHWLKDESVFECGIDYCGKKFNFFERRHHCRKCGGIFCKEHTLHYLYINHLAQFTTGGRGTLSRVCDRCIQEYNEFIRHEFGVACHKPLSRELLPQPAALNKVDYRKEIFTSKMGAGNPGGAIPAKLQESSEDGKAADQLVGSVPANWSWSSF
ncbi:FYVE zinc finger [Metschnikowia aff. pulcherrima]|uniref:FYVE zinc finger n=1 Tax=Metschnikowia aff. pulcherrima TaxID=2163413 RepID=A0A4P6XM26_9ASCO|nr:FYVE zinc finger [Metschnikowia aff. pulcherrima]